MSKYESVLPLPKSPNECKRSLRTNFQVYFDLPRSVSKRRRWQRLMNWKHWGAAKISKSMTAPLRHRRVSDLDPISVGTVIFAFTQCATIAASWIADNSLSLLFRYHSVCNDCRKLDCRFGRCSFNIKPSVGSKILKRAGLGSAWEGATWLAT